MAFSGTPSSGLQTPVRATRVGIRRQLWWVLCGLLLASCVSIPIQEMSDARLAISSAEDAGADFVAPTSMTRARSLMQQAQASLSSEQYAAAREQAMAAKQQAWSARRLARQIKAVEQDLDEARRVGADGRSVDRLLEQAQEAGAAGDEARAERLAARAKERAESQLSLTYRQRSEVLIAALSAQQERLTLSQQSSLTAARGALQRGELERAFELSRNLAVELGLSVGEDG